jgi:glycosyltransferase involved in cell wall biosynthesis
MITVIIPLFNGIEFLPEALLSVKEQIYETWDCIIGVNGHGPTGGEVYEKAAALVSSLADPRFSVVNLPEVRGAPAAIEALIALTQGEWIAHLDADDKWHPMKLHCQAKTVAESPEISFCGTWCTYFGDWEGGPHIPGGFIGEEVFRRMNPMVHSSMMFKKEGGRGGFTDEFVTYDYDCWLKNLQSGHKFYNVPLSLTYHRVYSGSHFNASGLQKPELARLKYFKHL